MCICYNCLHIRNPNGRNIDTLKDEEILRMAILVSDLHIRLALPDSLNANLRYISKKIYQSPSKIMSRFYAFLRKRGWVLHNPSKPVS